MLVNEVLLYFYISALSKDHPSCILDSVLCIVCIIVVLTFYTVPNSAGSIFAGNDTGFIANSAGSISLAYESGCYAELYLRCYGWRLDLLRDRLGNYERMSCN